MGGMTNDKIAAAHDPTGPLAGLRRRDAGRDDIEAACRYAARHALADLKAEAIRMADVVSSYVAGYALAELHRLGMQAMPAKIMEHARAALAEMA